MRIMSIPVIASAALGTALAAPLFWFTPVKVEAPTDAPSQPVVSRDHVLLNRLSTTFKHGKVALKDAFVNHVTSLTLKTTGVTSKLLTELAEVVITIY